MYCSIGKKMKKGDKKVRPTAFSPGKKKSKTGIPGLPRIQSGIPLLTDTDVSEMLRPYDRTPQTYVDLAAMDLTESYAESMC
jgi:hypothetical protein